jgi:hypothetical protein
MMSGSLGKASKVTCSSQTKADHGPVRQSLRGLVFQLAERERAPKEFDDTVSCGSAKISDFGHGVFSLRNRCSLGACP